MWSCLQLSFENHFKMDVKHKTGKLKELVRQAVSGWGRETRSKTSPREEVLWKCHGGQKERETMEENKGAKTKMQREWG